jgi:amino acid efflux transporter
MVAIYAAGMLAATLLLRTWSFGWWLAVVATIMTVALLVLAWSNLLVPALLALAAVAVTVVRRARDRRAGRASESSTETATDHPTIPEEQPA